MWKLVSENLGKVVAGVLTAIILAGFYSFWGFMIDAIEARAADWVKESVRDEIQMTSDQIVKKVDDALSRYEELQKQTTGTREQIYDVQRDLKSLNETLQKLLIRQLEAQGPMQPQ